MLDDLRITLEDHQQALREGNYRIGAVEDALDKVRGASGALDALISATFDAGLTLAQDGKSLSAGTQALANLKVI